MATTPRISFLIAAVVLVSLSGCTSNQPKPLYHWGVYQGQVYASLRGDTSPEEQIAALEKESARAAAAGDALPPGFRAHLGLLYAKAGHPERLVDGLEAEKAQFPESVTFMDFLLKKPRP